MPELPGSRASARARIGQGVAFLIGVGLLVWAISLAFSGKNQVALERLREIPLGTVAALGGLTALSLSVNGLIFWVQSLPMSLARRLPLGESLATNCLATFLSVVPFKLSLIARSAIHLRRHGMRVTQLLGWYAAIGAISLLVSLVVAGVLVPWMRASGEPHATMLIVAGLSGVLAAGLVAPLCPMGEQVLGRVPGLRAIVPHSAQSGRSVRINLTHALLRMFDFVLYGARFALLARAGGMDISVLDALALGSTFVVVSAVAPAGTLGFAEMGVAGVGVLVGLSASDVALLSLLTTASQSLVAGVVAVPAAIWLRPDRCVRELLQRRSHATAAPEGVKPRGM